MVGWRYQRGPRPNGPKPAATTSAPEPPRDIPWANRTDMSGTCTCLAIYSACRCADTNIRAQTKTAD